MMDDIRQAFREEVANLTWIDDETKPKVYEKVKLLCCRLCAETLILIVVVVHVVVVVVSLIQYRICVINQ